MTRNTRVAAVALPAFAVGLALCAGLAAAESVEMAVLPAGTFERAATPMPMRLAESMSPGAASALATAEAGAADQLAAMRAWNEAGKVPARAGFHRPLAAALEARLAPSLWTEAVGRPVPGGWVAVSPRGHLVWGTSVSVEGATRLRLHLEDVKLPEGTRLWVYGLGDNGRSFDLAYLDPEHGLWTPSVLGDRIQLEVELPEGARDSSWGFVIREVSQIFDSRGGAYRFYPEAAPEDCLEFGSCFDSSDFTQIEAARHGVFNYIFEQGGDSFTCSAALLNDLDAATTILWALTANHCISSTVADNTVEPLYNYYFNNCPWTSVHGDEGPVGATIRATQAIPGPDVTLMEMNPSGIGFSLSLLGWTNAPVPPGTRLYRLSHPVAKIPGSGDPSEYILPQMYSEHVDTHSPAFLCEDGDGIDEPDEVPLANFIYSMTDVGTTAGGSSGSPLMSDNGQVRGQLLGKCSAGGGDDCTYDMFNVIDGRFETSWPYLAPWLNPSAGGPCVPSMTTACLLGGRFRVEVQWFTIDATGPGQVMSFGGERAESDQSVFWWFFNAANFEMGVKMADACVAPFNAFWVFVSGLTNQGYDVTVTDTLTGAVRHFTNPLGSYPQTIGATGTSDGFPCP